jgi:hypothetical protein
MKHAAGFFAVAFVLPALSSGCRSREPDADRGSSAAPTPEPSTGASENSAGFLYGRVTLEDGATYEGRLRWGGDEEASWSDQFNGVKDWNPWVAHMPPGELRERYPIELFGWRLFYVSRRIDLSRPFMARFGDISRIEAEGREIRVTLKSGTEFVLDRFEADDLADGLRVWDPARGVVDIDEWRIRTIEFLPTPPLGPVPGRLHGTVRGWGSEFTGFLQWNRKRGSRRTCFTSGGATASARSASTRSARSPANRPKPSA